MDPKHSVTKRLPCILSSRNKIYWPTEITCQLFFPKFSDEKVISIYCIWSEYICMFLSLVYQTSKVVIW